MACSFGPMINDALINYADYKSLKQKRPRVRSARRWALGGQVTGIRPMVVETRVTASEMMVGAMGLRDGARAQATMGSEVMARAAAEEATVSAAVSAAVAAARAWATVARAAAGLVTIEAASSRARRRRRRQGMAVAATV